ncbi:hypothetical protein LZQ00_15505 [Sphingobacterium sp. SRCM116780]|uniref:hypothetical protein n=1 Tax=Sphingobacterium sp. SRCM116780 TaxID=2907623 RepID=UPI001F462F61|nr:hypothetical protein [Sphingobacterium sp. SRCM116780]UIR55663.1 hypothetical protein LZQ00_15505 [Sphingobacterium sp. SRCM116780]
MDELDQFKRQWKEDEAFKKVNQSDIKGMLQKSSTSIVKWIFIICCLELSIGIILSIILPYEKEEFLIFEILTWVYEILSAGAVLYFAYIFYTLLNNIKNTQNTKSLMENILAVRKNANHYIKFNLWCVHYTIVLSIIHKITMEVYETHNWLMAFLIFILGIFLYIVFGYIFIKIIKGYYYLIYGLLLKKLNTNYEELTRLEQE